MVLSGSLLVTVLRRGLDLYLILKRTPLQKMIRGYSLLFLSDLSLSPQTCHSCHVRPDSSRAIISRQAQCLAINITSALQNVAIFCLVMLILLLLLLIPDADFDTKIRWNLGILSREVILDFCAARLGKYGGTLTDLCYAHVSQIYPSLLYILTDGWALYTQTRTQTHAYTQSAGCSSENKGCIW